jgi:hypothetical protein
MAYKACNDCAQVVGTVHSDGCDVARCLVTGGQRLSCEGEDHDCGWEIWTGEWPGVEACRRLDLWCYWGPPWIKCNKDHPSATEDLNSLPTVAKWNKESQRWEKR